MNQDKKNRIDSSFRDPAGFIFEEQAVLYRQINKEYFQHYDQLINSGLYQQLVDKKMLLPHEELSRNEEAIVLKPQQLTFISYPYEWCFSQLKDAAILILKIQEIALKQGMILKDATAYNIQFVGSIPVFIDTLSFEKYEEGTPWMAYRQFCSFFIAPLLLSKYLKENSIAWLSHYLDGIPLPLTSKLLPWKSWLNPEIFMHLHLHAKTENKVTNKRLEQKKSNRFNLDYHRQLVKNLLHFLRGLELESSASVWSHYYDKDVSSAYYKEKALMVEETCKQLQPQSAIDYGANTGEFSELVAKYAQRTIALDFDFMAVERAYKKNNKTILPLCIDLSNPSSAIGWNNKERSSFSKRFQSDLALALGLLHHLVIDYNVPMENLAEFFANRCNHLLIEFIDPEDEKAQFLLHKKPDLINRYSRQLFEKAFKEEFTLVQQTHISGTQRILYHFRRREV